MTMISKPGQLRPGKCLSHDSQLVDLGYEETPGSDQKAVPIRAVHEVFGCIGMRKVVLRDFWVREVSFVQCGRAVDILTRQRGGGIGATLTVLPWKFCLRTLIAIGIEDVFTRRAELFRRVRIHSRPLWIWLYCPENWFYHESGTEEMTRLL
jgi:hypothetical protein